MKKTLIIPCLALAVFLVSCNSNTNKIPSSSDLTDSQDTFSSIEESDSDIEESTITGTESSDVDTSSTNNDEEDNRIIRTAGSYTFAGEIEGPILVEAGDNDDVEIILSGVTIRSNTNSPIYCKSANELKIKIDANTDNFIYDEREQLDSNNEDETQGKGAIYSKSDLKFTGKGNLTIEANYNNGIHTSDDLKIKNTGKLKVTSINHALKGNDSIEIESGKLTLNSKCGSGMKTENTDISSKGNQRGNIVITGGTIEVNSCEDAIEAANDLNISGTPSIKVLTSKFSSYTIGSISGSEQENAAKMYLRASNNTYNYSVSFKDSNGNATWVDASYSSSKSAPRGGTYYFYELQKPESAVTMRVFAFNKSTADRNESNAIGSMSNYININSNYDTAVISGSSSLSCTSWTDFDYNPGGGGGWGGGPGFEEGNTDKADYSAKGLKADNEIVIEGGEFDIKTYDDAIHANRGTALENGLTGVGNVTIVDGTFTLYSTDDGIHADYTTTISGGTIDIVNSYEGVEGNIINITGGYTKIYSTDDGLNAANKAGVQPSIVIDGGIIDITVYGNDVDGIDSNNTYTQNGGVVITKGGSGGMSTGLDTDGTAKVNGGSLIVFGKPEKSPSLGTGVTSYTLSGSYSIGTYLVSNDDNQITITTKYSYTTIYVYSSESSRYTVTKQ